MTTKKTVAAPKEKKGGYGLLSMMAMAVGIVIGSGIFAKNAGLITTSGSILLTGVAWLVGILIVVTMVIAFIEIISITEITDEQSTLSNWGRHLLGIRFGKSIGYYMTLFYFPLLIAGLLQFGANQLVTTITELTPGDDSIINEGYNLGIIVVSITVILLVIILSLNAFFIKPGKYLQNAGTAIKTIPLFFLIILLIVMLVMGGDKINFPTHEELEVGLGDLPDTNSFGQSFSLVFLTLPGILFAFDGFLLAGPLSKEAKSKSTFKTSFLLSVLFIAVVYVLYSVAVFGLGNPEEAGYGGAFNAINNVFEDPTTAKILGGIVNSIIVISIITGASGCSIAGARMLSDLSAHNGVADINGNYITKNENGVSPKAGIAIFSISVFWFAIYVAADAIAGSWGAITGWATDLAVIFAFAIYISVIIGGIINRFTKKVETKKSILFLPCAIISVVFASIVVLWFAFNTILPAAAILGNTLSEGYWTLYAVKLSVFILFLILLVITTIYNLVKTEKLTEEQIHTKAELCKEYYGDDSTSKIVEQELLAIEK